MISFPNAKINLGLHILSRRPDGYHNLETLLHPVRLYDALEIVPTEPAGAPTRFSQTGIPLAGDPQQNLVLRAYRLLQQHHSLPELDIYLQKHIPSGAGLGGGSADAAFMLKLLNETADLNLTNEQLENYAARLGADCPFFIRNQPALAQDTGTRLTLTDLSIDRYPIVIVKPPFAISTPEAYAGATPRRPTEPLLQTLRRPIEEWKKHLVNDFEASLFPRYPQLARLKQQLYETGALYASLSGSGSALFGLYEHLPQLDSKFPDATVLYPPAG
jgi:4-diphosphocytidyl-2-C-methyl-D-erythritol kinase